MAQFFNLTLDTIAPDSLSASGLQAYYNSAATVTISASSASFMYVWVDQNASGTAPASITWEPYATSKTLTPASQGTNYFHAIFMDNVGNISDVVNSASFVYDTVVPTVSAVSIEDGAGFTRDAEVDVEVTFSDATAGVNTITLGGDIATAEAVTYTLTAADRAAGSKTFTVTLQGADGTKSVTAVATDFAGNSSSAGSDTIVLDTTPASITPVLRVADDSANLDAFVNDTSYGVRINTQDTDIVSYKVWEGSSEPANWTNISNATAVANVGYFVGSQTLSSGDGLKTIHVKVQDTAGNVTEGTALTVTLDQTDPAVTLTVAPTVISAESGYNSAVFRLTATDTNSAQGLSYKIKLGSTVIKSGTYDGNDITITEAEMVTISAGEGTKSFTAEVTDIAGNTGTSTAQTVTVDLTAPTGTITADAIYGTQSVNVIIAGSDTGGATLSWMKVWLDAGMPSEWSAFSNGEYTFNNVAEGAHVAHLALMDSVGNIMTTVDSAEFVVDVSAPTGTITGPAYTGTPSITVSLSGVTDAKGQIAVSGLSQMKVWETGTTEPTNYEAFATSKSLTLTAVDGPYTVTAKVKDAAGNEATFVTGTINLDQDEPQGTILLFKADGITPIPAHVNVTGFVAHIAPNDITAATPTKYRVYGDFDEAMGSDEWTDYTLGDSYATVSGNLTDSDGTKTIYVVFKDAAGNVSTAASASTIYDKSAPVIDVDGPDYNIISKESTLRRDPSTAAEISGKYNNMITFTWSANEDLQAFKVCVNEIGQTAADAVAIGTTNGSQNMSGNSATANTDITSVIMGADFAATDAVNDTDGTYEIIVYGKDLAGTWSAVHVLGS